jgi:signal transduction histidine kinase
LLTRALIAAPLALIAVLVLRLLPENDLWARAAEVTELATYPVMLASATLLYVYFRVSPGIEAAWLATATIFGTAQGAGYAAVREAMERHADARPALMLVSHVVVVLILCAMLTASGRVSPPASPVLLGLLLALVTTVGRLLAFLVEPPPLLHRLVPVIAVVLMTLLAAMAYALRRQPWLPRAATHRLGDVIVMLGLAQVLAYPSASDDWRSVLVVVLDIGGAALLVITSLGLMQSALADSAQAERTISQLEEHVREEQTLIHEVAGTMAGISAATRLLSVPAGLAVDERHRLEQLLISETARVEGLLHASANPDGDVVDIDLDALIDPLLFAHGIRGRVVAWHPTGDHALARYDHLREVLDVLLDNAARHARSPILALTVTRLGDRVELAVVDHGPGIPPEIAGSVLEWGTRGAGSPGHGIGLNVAQRLVAGMGGRLRIESDGDVGTRVIVILQAVKERHEVV